MTQQFHIWAYYQKERKDVFVWVQSSITPNGQTMDSVSNVHGEGEWSLEGDR